MHAAALNASQAHERTYRSQDDTIGCIADETEADNNNLLELYGLKEARAADGKIDDADKYFSTLNDDRNVASDYGHYGGVVKRQNFTDLFLDEYNADKFIAVHLYGLIDDLTESADLTEIQGALNVSVDRLEKTFAEETKKWKA